MLIIKISNIYERIDCTASIKADSLTDLAAIDALKNFSRIISTPYIQNQQFEAKKAPRLLKHTETELS